MFSGRSGRSGKTAKAAPDDAADDAIDTSGSATAPVPADAPAASGELAPAVAAAETADGESRAGPVSGLDDAAAEVVAAEPASAEAAPTPPTPAEPSPAVPVSPVPGPVEPLPVEPVSPAPIDPVPVSPAPRVSGHAPIAPRPGEPEPASPEPVPDMPVSPAPAGPITEPPPPAGPITEPPMPDGPLADLPLPDMAGTSVADEVSAELAAEAAESAEPIAEPVAQPAPRKPEAGEWRGIVLVTGTDTDVGKTIVTSAIAAAAQAAGLRVAVLKPGQTGTAQGGPTDVELVNRLAAPTTARTLASFPEPLAPLAAARVANLPPLELYEVVDAVRAESAKHDLVLVEGAGGLLVPMGVRPSGEPWTLADLATTLGVSTIVVSRAGLGTLNHTALTLEALARRGVPVGVVLGAWPAEPELVHWANFSELLPHLVGALPDGAGTMEPGVFRRSAPGWLIPALYGVLDDWRVWAEEVS
jgi:dethiobiotin synthetase